MSSENTILASIKISTFTAAMFIASPAFAGNFEAGEKIFNADCASCHVGAQASKIGEHNLEKDAIAKVPGQ